MPLTAVLAAPRFETRDPAVVLSGNRLSVSLPIINSGDGGATAMTVTSIALGSAARTEPTLPLVLGDVPAGNGTAVTAFFSPAGLTPGTRLMLTVRGTYRSGGESLGFTINRVIIVPPATPPSANLLAARLQSSVNPATRTWSYVLVNEEPVGSARYLNTVSIDMVRPFTVTGTPPGWEVDTDSLTYVLWYATDIAPPYPHHVAPGASLGGFQIQAQPGVTSSEGRGYSITSWNHSTDQADLVAFGTTPVPARS